MWPSKLRWTLPTNLGRLQDMSSNAKRLGDAVRARRAELDLTQLEVWQAGGPSNTTLTKIENYEIETLTRTTARRLDAGLMWAPGSARAIWDKGATPEPANEQGLGHKDIEWMRDQIGQADLGDDLRRRLLRVLDDGRGSA